MSCLSSTVRAEKQAELAKYEARLLKLEAAFDAATEAGLSSYKFDSGEGSQQAKFMSLNDMTTAINFTQSRINRIRGELRGTGVFSMGFRRRG